MGSLAYLEATKFLLAKEVQTMANSCMRLGLSE